MERKLPISVIILTFNEEANIEACLRSVIGWASEVFVLDSGSTDATLKLVNGSSCHVFKHPFENYSHQRNWAQENLPLTEDWVFHIDADERVTPKLVEKLRIFFDGPESQQVDGLLLRRKIVFLGRHIKHGGIYPTYHCRVFRRDKGYCEDREYDQHFKVHGPTQRIEADLIELTASSLSSWTIRHNRWAHMEAQHLLENRNANSARRIKARLMGSPIQRRRWWRAAVYERSPIFLRSFCYFLVRYILRGGVRDGIPGLIYHVLHGFWFRFYVDACLYELTQPKNKN